GPERVAEEARYLRHVRGPRRPEECAGIGHRVAVPADLAGLGGEKTKEHAEQRRLPGADATGEDGECAALEAQPHVADAVSVRQACRLERPQIPSRPPRRRRECTAEQQRCTSDEAFGGYARRLAPHE